MPPADKATFFHAETLDLDRCQAVAETVQAIISGVQVSCFLSQNQQQVIFRCEHPDTLTRGSALVMIKQLLRSDAGRSLLKEYDAIPVIAFINEKGGVAKTTSCLNLAACLAEREKQVLLADLDAQANATVGLGVDPQALRHQPAEVFTKTSLPLACAILPTEIPGLDLLPADAGLSEASLALAGSVGREVRLRNKLASYLRNPRHKHYDYILFDAPPSMDAVTLNALMAASHLIIPLQPSYYSLRAMATLAGVLDSLFDELAPKVRLLGLLVTMYNPRVAAHRALYELLQEKVNRDFGPYLFSTLVPHCREMSESEAAQAPIVRTHPQSPAARAYQCLADEMLSRLEQETIAT